MRKFRTSKKFWLIILALILIGLFIYFVILPRFKTPIPPEGASIPTESKKDKFEPTSQIKSPIEGSWQNADFTFKVLDEDLDSGLNLNSCQYKVLSYEVDGQEHSSGWQRRKCNSLNWVGVGEEKWCRFEGERACWIFVSSEDKAQNQHRPAEEKGSIKYYHIDWTKPAVGKVFLEDGKANVEVSDNLKITGCNLYLDGENLGPMSFSVPGCQKECLASKTLNVQFEPGEHQIFAVCRDAAKNYGRGEELLIKENLPPKISSCRVAPTQGSLETNFQFFVEAGDPDNDEIFYKWEFGDGEISKEQNIFHNYLRLGTFEPRVKVFDGSGGEDNCTTAWVVVNE